MEHGRRRNRTIIIYLLAFMLLFLSACDDTAFNPSGKGKSETEEDTHYEIPEYREAVFSEKDAKGNKEVKIDISHAQDGYFAIYSNSKKKLKLKVMKDDALYIYNLRNGEIDIFPFQCGDGTYTIKAMKNVGDDKYVALYSVDVDVKLISEFEPYTIMGQYANYTQESKCVQFSRELAENSKNENDFVTKVFDYVVKNVKYDEEKAKTVKSGYIPDPDETFETGKGICFDYACLTASMMRSQGIPTKIIFGYVSPNDLYHAWNMYYTGKTGWVAVKFKVDPENWNRLDLTFSAAGVFSSYIGDGTHYVDIYQY